MADALPHRDSKNARDSMMIVLGKFTGGLSPIHDKGNDRDHTTYTEAYEWIRCDAHHMHWSTPITSGVRFSIVAFTFAS